MANCLDGLIGVYCPADGAGEAKYYLSEIPGINLQNAAATVDHESVSGANLLSKAIGFSQKIVVRDFLALFRKKQLFMDVVESDQVGAHGNDFVGTEDMLRGVQFIRSDMHDRYTYGFIEYVELKVNGPTVTQLWIQTESGEAESIDINIPDGISKIQVNRSFIQWARIWVNANDIDLSDPATTGAVYGCSNLSCDSGAYSYGYGCCGDNMRSEGIEQTPDGSGNPAGDWSPTNTYNGFVVGVSIKGNADELVCQHRDELAEPLLYRSAAYVMDEVVRSNRGNPYVRNTKEEARDIRREIMGGINTVSGFVEKGKYKEYLGQVVEQAIKIAQHSHSKAFIATDMRMGNLIFPYRPGPRSGNSINYNRRGRHAQRPKSF